MTSDAHAALDAPASTVRRASAGDSSGRGLCERVTGQADTHDYTPWETEEDWNTLRFLRPDHKATSDIAVALRFAGGARRRRRSLDAEQMHEPHDTADGLREDCPERERELLEVSA